MLRMTNEPRKEETDRPGRTFGHFNTPEDVVARRRNPRYAPESLERRLNPSPLTLIGQVLRAITGKDTAPTPALPTNPPPPPSDGTPPISGPTIPSGPGVPA